MASVYYTFEVREGGILQPNLAPTFLSLKRLDTLEEIQPRPAITPFGYGVYFFQFDPELSGESVAVIDAGPTIESAADRYFTVALALDSSRIQSALSSDGGVRVESIDTAARVGMKLAADGLAAILVEAGVDIVETLRRIAAALAGTSSGAGTGVVVFNAVGNPGTPRLESHVDAAGNRIAVDRLT